VLEHLQAGGLLMIPIVFCSILALAIIVERAIALRKTRVVPPGLLPETWRRVKAGRMDDNGLRELRQHSPLGRVLGAGLANAAHSREVMAEAIEDVGRHEAHRLERFLNTLGTIAAITPLLGLLGTVIGMIKVFTVISLQGLGDTPAMAGGISEALITTAAGLSVAIPTLMAYRYFRGRVDELVIEIEQEALKLVEVLQGQRTNDLVGDAATENGREGR